MTPEEALRSILTLVDGSDEVEDVNALQILLQSIRTFESDLCRKVFKKWPIFVAFCLAKKYARGSIVVREHFRGWISCPALCPQWISTRLNPVCLKLVLWLFDFKMNCEPKLAVVENCE